MSKVQSAQKPKYAAQLSGQFMIFESGEKVKYRDWRSMSAIGPSSRMGLYDVVWRGEVQFTLSETSNQPVGQMVRASTKEEQLARWEADTGPQENERRLKGCCCKWEQL